MGAVKSWIMDNAEKFYTIADNTAKECETYMEFVAKMQQHRPLLQGTEEGESFEYLLGDIWDEVWSKYQ